MSKHEIVLTHKRRDPTTLLVRCLCMQGLSQGGRDRRFYGYDWIAQVKTLEEAKEAFRVHVSLDG